MAARSGRWWFVLACFAALGGCGSGMHFRIVNETDHPIRIAVQEGEHRAPVQVQPGCDLLTGTVSPGGVWNSRRTSPGERYDNCATGPQLIIVAWDGRIDAIVTSARSGLLRVAENEYGLHIYSGDANKPTLKERSWLGLRSTLPADVQWWLEQ